MMRSIFGNVGICFLMGVLYFLSAPACTRRPDKGQGVGGSRGALSWTKKGPVSGTPISLTASDGTGLQLLGIEAKAVIQEPLAFTELHLTFRNPEDRVREGRFEITLPPGAAVSRFAMKISGAWQEAEVVERQRARQTYEDFLHRKQDPALLEKKAGNQFSARVFPIPAGSTKELIVSYSEELKNTPYTLRVFGLPQMETFHATVEHQTSSGSKQHTVDEKKMRPTGDLVFKSMEQRSSKNWTGLVDRDLAVVRVIPTFDTKAAPIKSLTVLFDTSASRSLNFANQLGKVSKVLEAIEKENGDYHLNFVCFDQTVFAAYQGPVSGFDASKQQEIAKRGALGASDLEGALKWMAQKRLESERLLIFGDGIATAGRTSQGELQEQIASLSKVGIKRVDVIADGGIRDESLLRGVVTAGLEQSGIVVESTLSAGRIAARIMQATKATVKVSVPDAEWVWPSELLGVQSGDEYLIYVGKNTAGPVQVHLEGITKTPVTIEAGPVARPLLERSSAIAQIEMVSGQLGKIEDEEQKASLKQRIVELSIAHRVLSDYTALLVLETEDDYDRFNIDRNALTDILVVGEKGVEPMHRSRPAQKRPIRMVKSSERLSQPSAAAPRSAPRRAEEGQMGRRDSARSDNHYGIRGPADNPEPQMARSSSASAPIGLLGTGRGGGGTGEGTIGLGNLNTIGHGGGGGSGSGYGRGAGGLGGRRGAAPRIRSGAAMVRGSLSKEVIRRIIHRHINEIKFCYERELARVPSLEGRIALKFIISGTGAVQMAAVANSTMGSPAVEECMAQAVRRWQFPKPEGGGIVIVTYPFQMTAPEGYGGASRVANTHARDRGGASAAANTASPVNLPPLFTRPVPDQVRRDLAYKGRKRAVEGKLQTVMELIQERKHAEALEMALSWRSKAPGDLLALIALGESWEAGNDKMQAARAYGSIIDLYPSRADMRRMAGQRLERLGTAGGKLAVDTYKKAVEQRPDHPASHRLLAWALLRDNQYKEALSAVAKGLKHPYPSGRFAGVLSAMRDEVGLIAAAWLRHDPTAKKEIDEKIYALNIELPKTPSTHFVLHWESDANDVDLHVYDKHGNHVSYQNKSMPTGGYLVADVTNGYGPEYFTITGKSKAGPYTLQAHYYSRGPMGYGMGTLQTIEHDGKGNLSFSHRPYIVMEDGAYVGLGTHEPSKSTQKIAAD